MSFENNASILFHVNIVVEDDIYFFMVNDLDTVHKRKLLRTFEITKLNSRGKNHSFAIVFGSGAEVIFKW